jgi:hypothetical protein
MMWDEYLVAGSVGSVGDHGGVSGAGCFYFGVAGLW